MQYPTEQMTVGARVKWAREQGRMSFNDLATPIAELGDEPRWLRLRQIEMGSVTPSADLLGRIAERTHVDREWLETGEHRGTKRAPRVLAPELGVARVIVKPSNDTASAGRIPGDMRKTEDGTLGAKARQRRIDLGMSQERVARKARCSNQQVSALELNKPAQVSAAIRDRILNVLGLNETGDVAPADVVVADDKAPEGHRIGTIPGVAYLIRKARARTNLTQEELALAAGLPKHYGWQFENANSTPPISLEHVQRLAKMLNVGMLDLLTPRTNFEVDLRINDLLGEPPATVAANGTIMDSAEIEELSRVTAGGTETIIEPDDGTVIIDTDPGYASSVYETIVPIHCDAYTERSIGGRRYIIGYQRHFNGDEPTMVRAVILSLP